MSNSIVLRTVYALDSNTSQFIPSGQVLTTDGSGGTYWGYVGQPNITSTVGGLGTSGYISSFSLISTVQQLGSAGYVSTASITSTMQGMGSAGYISTSGLISTVQGLGSARYLSTHSLVSSIIGLGTATYISTASLISTSYGIIKESAESLGTAGYISSASLNSTTAALGTLGYISSASLYSTTRGLGSFGFISTSGLVSTVRGLGTSGYVSTSYLQSTIAGLGTLGYVSSATSVSEIRFDNTGSVTTINSINTFATGTVVTEIKNNSFSTFIGSSLYYTGNQGAMSTTIINYHALQFSTAIIDFSPFREYIYSSTVVTLDLYPNIAFSKLGTGATNVGTFAMSTFLQNVTPNLSSVTTTFLNATNTTVRFEGGTTADSSNFYTTPIKLTLRPGTISNYTNPYTVMHYMPSTLNDGQFQNALHSNYITVSYGSTGSLFISIQNTQ